MKISIIFILCFIKIIARAEAFVTSPPLEVLTSGGKGALVVGVVLALNTGKMEEDKNQPNSETEMEGKPNVLQREMDMKMKIARHNLLSVAASIMCVPSEIFTTPPMVDPNPPTNPKENARKSKIADLLSKGWFPADGYEIPLNEVNYLDGLMGSNGAGQRPSTYGEITTLGARQLFDYMGLVMALPEKIEELTFVDLGCGNGKLLVQAYMEVPVIHRIIGVELSRARYKAAARAWDFLRRDARDIRLLSTCDFSTPTLPVRDAVVEIVEGDLFQLDISSATHIYVASLCFTDDMMNKLGEKLTDEGGQLQCIATLKPFPEKFNKYLTAGNCGGNGYNDAQPRKHYVEMSWTKARGTGATVYFYDRQRIRMYT